LSHPESSKEDSVNAAGVLAPLAEPEDRTAADHVPRWLAAMVVFLFVAVLGVGGLVADRALMRKPVATTGPEMRVRILEDAVRQRPDDLDSRRQLAFAYQQVGRDREALREYERVLDGNASDLAALFNTGVIFLETGREDEGERSLLRVLKLAPSHALAAKTLGEYYAESGEFGRVVDIAAPAADSHLDMADLQYLAGFGYEKTGCPDEAEARYRRALSLVPDLAEARDGLKRLERQ
jgi:tetratricopeptide (TPR) repeat protein